MKKHLSILVVCTLLFTGGSGALASSHQPEYTLSTKGVTVLQNEGNRAVPSGEAASHAAVAGESPVTGLPWEGEYLPLLVQIGNYTGTVTVNGRKIKSSGIGKNAPWGMQYADIVYEQLLYSGGTTRFVMLFSDCFAQGEPADGAGPVRSCRIGAVLLREEWQAGLVYAGDFNGDYWNQLLNGTGVMNLGVMLNAHYNRLWEMCCRVKGVKAPNNYNADILAMRDTIPDTYTAAARAFLFSDRETYGDAYEAAGVVHLDWGRDTAISHFVYDTDQNAYLRYCGAGTNEAKWAPFTTFASSIDRSDEGRQQVAYSNLIVQRVSYEFENDSAIRPVPKCVGSGNADLFIGGRYIPGTWVRVSLEAPTVYYDDQGNELQFNRGKTFIAQFPPEGLCAFESGT